MKKSIFVSVLCLSFIFSLQGQSFYSNKYISVKAYFNMMDSSISLNIENKCDSVLVFNAKTVNYFMSNDFHNYLCDMSLIRSGINLLQPNPGSLMEYKRLLPHSTFFVVINKFIWKQETELFLSDIDSFNLNFRIQYIVTTFPDIFTNNSLNNSLVEALKKGRFRTHGFEANLIFDPNHLSECYKFLKMETLKYSW